jgi:hypothetical protein
MHVWFWLVGLWAAAVAAIWRVIYILDQPPKRHPSRIDNVIPFRRPPESTETRVSRLTTGLPGMQRKQHGSGGSRPSPFR